MLSASVIPLRSRLIVSRRACSVVLSTTRPFSSSSNDGKSGNSNNSIPFRPRRRPSRNYRPLSPRTPKRRGPLDPYSNPTNLSANPITIGEHGFDDLETAFGPYAADAIRHSRQKTPLSQDDFFNAANYMTARAGTTEDLVGERRALAMALWEDEDREDFMQTLDQMIEEERIRGLELGEDDLEDPKEEEDGLGEIQQQLGDDDEDPNTLVHGDWAETVIQVDRVQKVQRGGTMVRYRTLLIGGNGQGVAGFGVGKANTPAEATIAASRMCKRNIFFLDRYKNTGLTHDLAGRHNSCRVVLRATRPNAGLSGHDLVKQIMMLLGVTDCSSKTHGNRNQYNVVRATFKAILTHESMEELALKRGKRLLNLERVKRLQI